MNFFQKFMNGRYGSDQLNFVLLIVYIVVCIIASALRLNWLNIAAFAIVALVIFRMFSRNIYKRQNENAKFLQIIWEIKNGSRGGTASRTAKKDARRFERDGKKTMRADREHKYFKCKNCGAISRVPRGKGKIEITCPKCGNKIIGKS
ncbi:MAG: hypothetical protein VB112_00360 [Oscillospiraceae bacterium]|nr:hypothetical protein [Oscillospiraceae bacterium]